MSFRIRADAGTQTTVVNKSIFTRTNNQSINLLGGQTGDLSLTCIEGIIIYTFEFTFESTLSSTFMINISHGKTKESAINVRDLMYTTTASQTLTRTDSLNFESTYSDCLFIDVTATSDAIITLSTTYTRLPNNQSFF